MNATTYTHTHTKDHEVIRLWTFYSVVPAIFRIGVQLKIQNGCSWRHFSGVEEKMMCK